MDDRNTIQVTMSFHRWSRLLIILEWVMAFKFFRTMNIEMDEVRDLYKVIYIPSHFVPESHTIMRMGKRNKAIIWERKSLLVPYVPQVNDSVNIDEIDYVVDNLELYIYPKLTVIEVKVTEQ